MTDTTQSRIYADKDRIIPFALIRAVVVMVLLSLAIVSYARLTDRPLQSTPPLSEIRFETEVVLVSDGMSGAVQVYDKNGVLVWDMTPEEGGFVAGVHRVIVFERMKSRAPIEGPVRITAMENGRIAIADPATGWAADLMGFGADNASVFAQLLALMKERN